MKSKFAFLFCLFLSMNSFAQENFTFPVYPGCKKNRSNAELQDCFQNKLRFELLVNLDSNYNQYFEGNMEIDFVDFFFTITKDGKIEKLSYTTESNPIAARNFLKQIYRLSKYYNSKKKSFLPATQDGQPVDYVYKMRIRYEIR